MHRTAIALVRCTYSPWEEPPLASHLASLALYHHRGIYIGSGHVPLTGLACGLSRGPAEDVSLEQFARGRDVRFNATHCDLIVAKSWSVRVRAGASGLRLLASHREHFCI